MKNSLEIIDLNKTYKASNGKKINALDNLNLKVKKGSFCAFLGKNGAGKSTCIGVIAGTIIRDSGRIIIEGYDNLTQEREAKLSMGIVPQELNFDYFFTVREILENQAGIYGVRKKDRITDELIDKFFLSEVANKKITELSGGMKRRLLIAKAMIHQPPFLILDEPTEGVDIELRVKIYDYLKEINRKGVTILVTTHHLEDIENVCDSVIFIDHGKVIAQDTVKNVIKSITDDYIIRIESKDKFNDWKKLFSESGIHCSEIKENMIEISIDKKSNISLKETLQRIFNSNLNIQQLFTKHRSLEDAFFKLLD